MGNQHFFKGGAGGRRENKHKIKSRQEGNNSIIKADILHRKSFEQQKLDVETPLKEKSLYEPFSQDNFRIWHFFSQGRFKIWNRSQTSRAIRSWNMTSSKTEANEFHLHTFINIFVGRSFFTSASFHGENCMLESTVMTSTQKPNSLNHWTLTSIEGCSGNCVCFPPYLYLPPGQSHQSSLL